MSLPRSATHGYQFLGRGNTAYTLARPIAAPARASPEPGEDIDPPLRGGLRPRGYRHLNRVARAYYGA